MSDDRVYCRPYYFDDLLNSSDHPPQHQTHSFESYNDNPHYGYPLQEPFVIIRIRATNKTLLIVHKVLHNPSTRRILYLVNHYPPQETSKEMLQVRENLMQSIQTFLKKFNSISFRETPKVLTQAWDNFFEIQHAQPEDKHELLRKLLEDLQNINEELAYINSPSLNRTAFYDDNDNEYSIQVSEKSPIAITPVLPTEELDNSISMGDEHLSTIPKIESDEVIKSSVENLVLILNDIRFIEQLLYDDTSSEDNFFEDIDYVEASPPDFELVSLEEVKDDNLRAKLLNIYLLIAKIESLKNNPTPDCVLKSHSLSFLSYNDNSSPEFETFSDHAEETSSGSTITHANNSPPEYDSFLFEIEPNQGELSSIAMEGILGEPRVYVPNILPTHPTLLHDSDFSSSDDSLGSGFEVSKGRIARIVKILVLMVLSIVHSICDPSHAYIWESDILDLIDLTFNLFS
nr:hypothetical protein [Tanacetum cinerariifolium]